jgi:serine phosphatase RsbU (regulator of sigma subunit)
VLLSTFGQSNETDSLINIFHTKYKNENKNDLQSDTIFLNYAHKISSAFLNINDLYSALKYNIIEDQFYQKISAYHKNKAFLDRTLYNCVYERITILERKESYNDALDLSFELLKRYENTNQFIRTSNLLDEIGYIYFSFKNYDKALSFYQKAGELIKQTGDTLSLGINYINLYGTYAAMNNSITAVKYCYSALSCFKSVNYKPGMRVVYGNLAFYYENINIDKALANMELSISLKPDSIDLLNPGLDENTLGRLYLKKAVAEKNSSKKETYLKSAEIYLEKAKRIAKRLNNKSVMKDCLGGFASVEKEKKNFEKALDYLNLYNVYSDSISSDANASASVNSLMKYEFDKKEQQQQLLADKKEALKQKELEKQRLQKNFFILGFILVSVFAVFAFRSFKSKQKAHKIITAQKLEVEKQKHIVETKQSQLLQSINYAQRIQNNLLKSELDLKKIIPNSFIIFKPRDIVSGDFYWFTKSENDDIIIVLGDCTGHGVPGALLSMIGITSLNEIVNHQKETDPGQILSRLSMDLHDAFSKDDALHKTDGMDFSVCKISISKNKLLFAGVNQALYILNTNNALTKIEPQINSVNGIFDIDQNEKVIPIEINLSGNDCYYLSSDGLIDQIGEQTGKKYLSKRFEESIIKAQITDDFESQKKSIIDDLNNWQGNYKQIDDMAVIGFKA